MLGRFFILCRNKCLRTVVPDAPPPPPATAATGRGRRRLIAYRMKNDLAEADRSPRRHSRRRRRATVKAIKPRKQIRAQLSSRMEFCAEVLSPGVHHKTSRKSTARARPLIRGREKTAIGFECAAADGRGGALAARPPRDAPYDFISKLPNLIVWAEAEVSYHLSLR